ncbi:hypothetical protein CRUP_038630 [Coryphaenoides rupestris]|nr:hypothetical protein CRUP_038630 [Coryphaenoides rupestris]
MADTKGMFDFAIDRGGTFTDVFARLADGRERVLKLLSRDPQNYKDAPTEGIRRVLEEPRTNRIEGTSTDVSRYAGRYEHVFEATTAGVTLQAPQLDINTVAAGSGSRLFFR